MTRRCDFSCRAISPNSSVSTLGAGSCLPTAAMASDAMAAVGKQEPAPRVLTELFGEIALQEKSQRRVIEIVVGQNDDFIERLVVCEIASKPLHVALSHFEFAELVIPDARYDGVTS